MATTTTKAMARRYWLLKIRGHEDVKFGSHDLDSDGRKVRTTVKAFMSEGLIETKDDCFVGTKKLGDTVSTDEPNIVVMSGIGATKSPYDVDQLKGAPLERMTEGNLRYIAEHVNEYTFVNRWGKTVDRSSFEGEYVANVAFNEACDLRRQLLKVDDATGRNLAWGLHKAGFIAEVDADAFNCQTGASFLEGHSFGVDPDKWESDATTIVAELRERIARDTRKVNAIVAADAKVREAGGWPAFIEEYKPRIAAAVTKKGESK